MSNRNRAPFLAGNRHAGAKEESPQARRVSQRDRERERERERETETETDRERERDRDRELVCARSREATR